MSARRDRRCRAAFVARVVLRRGPRVILPCSGPGSFRCCARCLGRLLAGTHKYTPPPRRYGATRGIWIDANAVNVLDHNRHESGLVTFEVGAKRGIGDFVEVVGVHLQAENSCSQKTRGRPGRGDPTNPSIKTPERSDSKMRPMDRCTWPHTRPPTTVASAWAGGAEAFWHAPVASPTPSARPAPGDNCRQDR